MAKAGSTEKVVREIRRRLEPRPRHCRLQRRFAQRPHEPLHRFVAALVLLPAQLLKQYLRRVAHLRRTLPQMCRMRRQQRVLSRRPLIRPPLRLPQAPPHCLPVKIQLASNRSDRCARRSRSIVRSVVNILPLPSACGVGSFQ